MKDIRSVICVQFYDYEICNIRKVMGVAVAKVVGASTPHGTVCEF